MLPENLPSDAFKPVSGHRQRQRFLAGDQAQPGLPGAVAAGTGGAARGLASPVGLCGNPLEVPARELLPTPRDHALDLRAKLDAALGAAGLEHGTAAASLHPRTKSMQALALELAGLVGALHGVRSLPTSSSGRRILRFEEGTVNPDGGGSKTGDNEMWITRLIEYKLKSNFQLHACHPTSRISK